MKFTFLEKKSFTNYKRSLYCYVCVKCWRHLRNKKLKIQASKMTFPRAVKNVTNNVLKTCTKKN